MKNFLHTPILPQEYNGIMSKEQKEILPVCGATGDPCAQLKPPFFCSKLERWQKMGEEVRKAYIIRRFPHGECSLIRRMPEVDQGE